MHDPGKRGEEDWKHVVNGTLRIFKMGMYSQHLFHLTMSVKNRNKTSLVITVTHTMFLILFLFKCYDSFLATQLIPGIHAYMQEFLEQAEFIL